jgi:hypothetical protein
MRILRLREFVSVTSSQGLSKWRSWVNPGVVWLQNPIPFYEYVTWSLTNCITDRMDEGGSAVQWTEKEYEQEFNLGLLTSRPGRNDVLMVDLEGDLRKHYWDEEVRLEGDPEGVLLRMWIVWLSGIFGKWWRPLFRIVHSKQKAEGGGTA